jgi:transcriptional regulator with XRE-family HTH domain
MSDSILVRDIIRERREELGLTQTDLARAMGIVSSEFVCMIESGKRHFALNNIPKLASVLWLDAEALCRCALYEAAPSFYRSTFGERVPARPKPLINQ